MNLMQEIRKGGTLRHISPEKTAIPVQDTRGTLLGQIRQGVILKKVAIESLGPAEPGVEGPGIAGMLQKALQERGMAMGMSSSDESDGDEDDEWD